MIDIPIITDLIAATVQFSPMTKLPFLTSSSSGSIGSATEMFNALFKLSITIGAMLAVFMFIVGGLQMIMAKDSSGSIGEGKKKMSNAVMGLLMLISTFVVLNTINPQLTSLTLFKDASGNDISKLEAPAPKSQTQDAARQTIRDLFNEFDQDIQTLAQEGTEAQKDAWCEANKTNSPGATLSDLNGYCSTVWAKKKRDEKFGSIEEAPAFPKGICGSSTSFGITLSGYSCGYKSVEKCQEDNKSSCRTYSGDYVLLSPGGTILKTFSGDSPQKNNYNCIQEINSGGVNCKIKELVN